MKEIKIIDQVSLNQGATPDEGIPIYNNIVSSLNKKEEVILDFINVDLVTTAFLNVILGRLYERFSSDELKELLKLKNVTESIGLRIKAVTDTAKAYYLNKEEYNQDIDSIIYGNN